MIYFDSSAIVRLIRWEHWSDELGAFMAAQESDVTLATSGVGVVEVFRVLVRDEADAVTERRARELLEVFDRVELTGDVINTAARLHTKRLRTLDAIHVASALELGQGLTTMISYDLRMIDAACEAGLMVTAPGMID